jgi:2-dehydro-3-deoxyphosphogluconate aldolase/(4S)-4-hydroxy-2-oxoglutarate aldolase
MSESAIFQRLEVACVVAVLILDRSEDAVPVAEALLAGGVTAMELTLRTPVALDALREVKRACPEMLAGIGTVLRPDQVTEVIDAGGDFAVSPGMNPRVVEKAIASGLPFAPGICTPSDIERALEYDRRLLKFFPAEPSGGLPYLRTIAAPYAHLGIKYLPLGGVSTVNMELYLREPVVGGIGGSWLAPREIIQRKNWAQITAAAEASIAMRDQSRRRKP